jgi:hypothetical protein
MQEYDGVPEVTFSLALRPMQARNRLRSTVLVVTALAFSGNGLWMLADPAGWFASVPGVMDTGPFNMHFVRDVGCAYLVLACAIGMASSLPAAQPLLLLASLSVGLHAALHGIDIVAGRLPLEHLSTDFGGVFLPAIVVPLLALWSGRERATP